MQRIRVSSAFLCSRLSRYRQYMVCRPRSDCAAAGMRSHVLHMDALSALMLYGFALEAREGDVVQIGGSRLIGTKIRKVMRVPDFENVLKWLHIDSAVIAVPSSVYLDVFPSRECLDKNVVYELWSPMVSRAPDQVRLLPPEDAYIVSFDELLRSVEELLDDGIEAYVYALSKYVQPGYLARFLKLFDRRAAVKIYVAVEEAILAKYGPAIARQFPNVWMVPTRSHRKILVIIYRRRPAGQWCVVGYRGSMNIFFPGVDDYLESVSNFTELQRVLHGLLRAFLVV